MNRGGTSQTVTAQAGRLVLGVNKHLGSYKTEEELKIGFEQLLAPLFEKIGIKGDSRYERHTSNLAILRGRPDAIHGKLIIEYEAPLSFRQNAAVNHAREQLTGYISGELAIHGSESTSCVGVGFDGEKIFFLHYAPIKAKKIRTTGAESFKMVGPFVFDLESAKTFILHLRSLARLPLTPEALSEKFGPSSEIAKQAIAAYYNALSNWATPRVTVFLNEWKRLFGIIYGEHFLAKDYEKSSQLGALYSFDKDVKFQELLFCVHTYFAFVIKLLAIELLKFQDVAVSESFSDRLVHGPKKELMSCLDDIESGGIFLTRGITNFLEGDFFRWYLDAFSPDIEDVVRDVARAISLFEPATATVSNSFTKDLLKRLYQYLIPREIRHALGEFYTPDWLAQLVIAESGFNGEPSKRVMDPACGSGTFLALAIAKIKEKAKEEGIDSKETAKTIINNVWGFDLNPLAVIASRTNYLFAMGPLVAELDSFEIPVYLADSVVWPERRGQMSLRPQGNAIEIQTSLQPFHVPRAWVEGNGFLMKRAAPIVEKLVANSYSVDDAMEVMTNEGLVGKNNRDIVAFFYEEILSLEKQGRDRIWPKLLKNTFAPYVAGTSKFDFVVGNPPWIRWGYLSKAYREATITMWHDYGLFSLKGLQARLGGGEKDFSMLFLYACADYYLKEKGVLGFLITQEVFKSKGAGEGFRRFQLGDREMLRVIAAHDLVAVQPFEGAANKTACIILRKGSKTEYPLPYAVWRRKKGVGKLPTGIEWAEAKLLLKKDVLTAQPVGQVTGAWRTAGEHDRNKTAGLEGQSDYEAHIGARAEPYGVFWINVHEKLPDNELLISNQAKRGKRKVKEIKTRIETKFVFPAVRGKDVKRWLAKPGTNILMVQDAEKQSPIDETEMKQRWPKTYAYLSHFKRELLSRGSKTVRQLAERTAFYAMFGIGNYTVAKYKVVWKRMTNDLSAAVVSEYKTPYGNKMVVPLDTTSLFAFDDEQEAHYVCAILNSNIARSFVKSYASAGRGFGSPSVFKHLAISRFDKKNAIHLQLAKLSLSLHDLMREGSIHATGPEKMEKRVDELAEKLFSTGRSGIKKEVQRA